MQRYSKQSLITNTGMQHTKKYGNTSMQIMR